MTLKPLTLSVFLILALPQSSIASERTTLTTVISEMTAAQHVLKAKLSQSDTALPSFRGNVNNLLSNTVTVISEEGIGSGVILHPREFERFFSKTEAKKLASYAIIITNFHVVESMRSPTVVFYPGAGRPPSEGIAVAGEVISVDISKDLAILATADRPEFAAGVFLGNVSTDIIGDTVEAIGHPEGNFWTYTKGYVSQVRLKHEWQYQNREKMVADVIQTQTPISSGNSGGPLFDRSNRLIGINTMGSDGQNINFAVSVEEVKKLTVRLDQMQVISDVKKVWTWETTPQILSNYDLLDSGSDGSYDWQTYSDPSGGAQIVAMFADKSLAPYLYYETEVDGKKYTVFLNPVHEHLTAWFAIDILEGKETIASGWDFDGDFVADYLF